VIRRKKRGRERKKRKREEKSCLGVWRGPSSRPRRVDAHIADALVLYLSLVVEGPPADWNMRGR
jgi:hypothetical protein